MEERVQKLLAAAGICSRRTAETYIAAGRVSVNGRPAELGTRADPDRDDIRLDGRPLAAPRSAVWLMLNKPRGCVTTLRDERGRPTVADLVRGCGERVFPVGRLDMDSEGLVLLTNDGALAQRLLHPRYEISKTYEVTVTGPVAGAAERLAAVRSLEGEPIVPAQVTTLRSDGSRALLAVTIHQGKNRQIRRMCAQCGLSVRRLRRVREGGLELGDLPPGKWRYLTDEETALLARTHEDPDAG